MGVRRIMGHRLPGYGTTEIYAKYRPDYLSAAAEAIDAFMSEARMAAPSGPRCVPVAC